MKFLGFSKIGEENLWKIFHFKNFFFFLKNIFQRFSSPILEPSKNCIFSFFFLLGLERKSFSPEKDFSFFGIEIEISGDFSFIRLFS